ncbi:RAM signaling pathway protein-domain-containing protein [Dipodascopsis uninucleata]
MSLSAEPMERSRSNSESIVNASARASKRMGFVVRRNADLSTVAEATQRGSANPAMPIQIPPLQQSLSSGSLAGYANGAISSQSPSTQSGPAGAPMAGIGSSTGGVSLAGLGAPGRRRHHTRGVSHDSVIENPYGGGHGFHIVLGSTPLTATSSQSSASSSSASTSQRDRSQAAGSLSSSVSATPASTPGKELENPPSAYFRRLSAMQDQISPTAAAMLSTAAFSNCTVESAREILFSLSQVLPAVRQYMLFCDDRKLTGALSCILVNAKGNIDTLIRSLEHYDGLISANAASGTAAARRAPPPTAVTSAIEPIVQSSLACISSFKHIVSILHANVRALGARADIRHVRAFFLLLFGALAEVNNGWSSMLPALADCHTSVTSYLRPSVLSAVTASTTSSIKSTPAFTQPELMPPPPLPLPTPALWPSSIKSPISLATSNLGSNTTSPNVMSPGTTLFSPIGLTTATPSSENPYAFHFPLEPSEFDEELYERISVATTSALHVLGLIHDGIIEWDNQNDLKIRELASMSDVGLEVTSRLRVRLKTIRGGDTAERLKFGDETTSFVRVLINILEYTKNIMNELDFLSDARPILSALTRVMKDILTVNAKQKRKAQEDELAASAAATGATITNAPPSGIPHSQVVQGLLSSSMASSTAPATALSPLGSIASSTHPATSPVITPPVVGPQLTSINPIGPISGSAPASMQGKSTPISANSFPMVQSTSSIPSVMASPSLAIPANGHSSPHASSSNATMRN